jgi:hypothetical protein
VFTKFPTDSLGWIYNLMGLGANSHTFTSDRFVAYIQNGPQFYDGSKSKLPFANATCGDPKGFFGLFCPGGIGTIQSRLGDDGTAITVTPSYPFRSFWQPTYTRGVPQEDEGFGVGIDPDNNGVNIFNESIIFHEALHGMTGQDDSSVQTLLDIHHSDDTTNISIHIKDNVLQYCPSFK